MIYSISQLLHWLENNSTLDENEDQNQGFVLQNFSEFQFNVFLNFQKCLRYIQAIIR